MLAKPNFRMCERSNLKKFEVWTFQDRTLVASLHL